MKGYFSTLAKQSGLRYAKENTASPASGAKERAGKSAPLHREKIVLVSPPEAFENLSPPKNERAVKNSVKEKSDAANQESDFGTEERGAAFGEPRQSDLEKWNSAQPTAVEQIIFKENETAETIEEESASRRNLHSGKIRGKAEDKTIEETSVQPEYFNKTAAILESGTADKAEIQQILLQEINEWVNAAPAAGEAENEFETGNQARAVLPSPVKHKPAEISPESSNNLQEQNFNLSIGTITVVIEEPDNQPKAAPENQNRSVEKPKPEKPGFSRLSRDYL
jgi:hypothetical protein